MRIIKNLVLCLSGYSRAGIYVPNDAIQSSRAGKVAYLLFLFNIVFMIRGFALSNLIEVTLFVIFIFNAALRREFLRAMRDSAFFCLALFYLWVCLSGMWSEAEWSDILKNWWGWRKILLVPIGLVVLSNKEKAERALYVLVVMGLIYLAVALVDLLGLGQIWGRDYTTVAQDANVQGLYFVIAGSSLLLMGWARRRRPPIGLSLIITGGLFLAFVVFFGISRSGYTAFIVAALGLGMYLSGGKKTLGVLGAMLIASVFLIFSPIAEKRVNQALAELAVGAEEDGGAHTSGSIRYVMWSNTLGMIYESPVLGTGAGGFQLGYAKTVAEQEGWRATVTEDPHSHYLHIFSQYGVVGFLLFCTYQLMLGIRVLSGSANCYLLGITLGAVSMIAVFNGVFGAFAMGRLAFISLTILASLCFFESQRNRPSRGSL